MRKGAYNDARYARTCEKIDRDPDLRVSRRSLKKISDALDRYLGETPDDRRRQWLRSGGEY